jgi:hypothetical protein
MNNSDKAKFGISENGWSLPVSRAFIDPHALGFPQKFQTKGQALKQPSTVRHDDAE